MRTHHTPHPQTPDGTTTPEALLLSDRALAGIPAAARRSRYDGHGRAALVSALDEGLEPDELARILAGRTVLDAFPVSLGESPADYAARAVAEMFVAYLQ